MLLRLVGGKGGFGALLRGLGRDGSKTVNQDACRDLQGRRLRYSNAEKKLQEWQDQAHEREMEKVALKHIKEQERAEKREARAKVEVDVIVKEQKDVVSRVAASVQEAMAGTSAPLQQAKRPAPDRAVPPAGSGPGTSGSGKAAGPAGPVKKKPKMLAGLESFGSDESDLSDSDEE